MSSEGWANALGNGSEAHKAFTEAINQGLPVEDAFNAALATTNSESEREQMTRKALNGLYSESSSTFKKMNKDIIDGNKAQADLSLQFNVISSLRAFCHSLFKNSLVTPASMRTINNKREAIYCRSFIKNATSNFMGY